MDKSIYDKKFYEAYAGQYFGDVVAPIHVKLFRPWLYGDVLDIGAGSGAMMDIMSKLSGIRSISGIDIYSTRQDIKEASITNMPFPDESFNCIVSTGTLEHLNLDELKAGLKEAHRVLRQWGFIMFSVPYQDNLKQNQVYCPHCHNTFDRWGHQISFNEPMIHAILSDFDIMSIFTAPVGFLTSHPNLAPFVKIIRLFGFFKGDDLYFVVAQKIK